MTEIWLEDLDTFTGRVGANGATEMPVALVLVNWEQKYGKQLKWGNRTARAGQVHISELADSV